MVPSPLPTLCPVQIPVSARPTERASAAAHGTLVAEVGARIRSLRLASGFSGGALAKEASISHSMLSRIERGITSPSLRTLNQIAEALDVPTARLFGTPPFHVWLDGSFTEAQIKGILAATSRC